MMEEPGGLAVSLAIPTLSSWLVCVSPGIDPGLRCKGSGSGAVVMEVGVVVERYDGDAVVTYRVCLGLLADELLACGAADLHPAGAVAPTDGFVSPVSGDLPGSGWRDAVECLGDRVLVVAFHAVVALDVEAELVCEVGNRGLGDGASVDGDDEAYGGVGAQPLSLILFAYIFLLL